MDLTYRATRTSSMFQKSVSRSLKKSFPLQIRLFFPRWWGKNCWRIKRTLEATDADILPAVSWNYLETKRVVKFGRGGLVRASKQPKI